MTGTVESVSCSAKYTFTKPPQPFIRLLAGVGVEGDAHMGATVRHRHLLKRDPRQPNLRQVHLMPMELLDEFAAAGFLVAPGELGENITTRGLPLLTLPANTRLRIGSDAVIQITGLRSPCGQIDLFQPGLLKQVISFDDTGRPVYRSGIMAIVLQDGEVRPGDLIHAVMPAEPYQPLPCV
jgi:MOSC domain-containing protein YiiM